MKVIKTVKGVEYQLDIDEAFYNKYCAKDARFRKLDEPESDLESKPRGRPRKVDIDG